MFWQQAIQSYITILLLFTASFFYKVEMFAFVAPSIAEEEAIAASAEGPPGPLPPCPSVDAALDSLVRLQMSLFAELCLHFRVLDMPTEVSVHVCA